MALAPQLTESRTLIPSESPEYLASIPMSFDEYIDWDYNGGLVEWVDGTSYVYMSASYEHQRIVKTLLKLLDLLAEETDAGTVLTAPYAMQSNTGRAGREPDLMFISSANRDRMQSGFLVGAADIVVEVVSTDSVARDRVTKRREYAQSGVREYWLIESRTPFQWAEFLVLRDGEFVSAPVTDGVYRSEVAEGFWLRTDWLWDYDLRTTDALREILAGPPASTPGHE